MYWIHRIGRGVDNTYAIHFDALWHLLTDKNCLTIGWQCFVDDAAVVNAVTAHNPAQVEIELKARGIHSSERIALKNFSQFNAGDIVVVLPIPEYEKNFLVVELKSPAQSILNVPPVKQTSFTVNTLEPSGRTIDFNPHEGFVYVADNSPVDAGFFCEVDIIQSVPRASMSQLLKILCDNVLGTNAPVSNVVNRQHIYDTLIPIGHKTRITRP